MEENCKDPGLILVMGVTGSGKSRFVNMLQPGSAKVGDSLYSETSTCSIVRVKLGRDYVDIVDTPGFDDTTRSDAEILETITKTLATQYALGLRLKGIIYFHKITDNRLYGSARKNMIMFQELCGEGALGNVILLTTMWDQVESQAIGARRQQQLRDEFWSDMIARGSLVRQFDGSRAMAEALVSRLLDKEDVVLQIQRDIVDRGMSLEATSAGAKVADRLDSRLRDIDRDAEFLAKEQESAARGENTYRQAELAERQEKLTAERKSVWFSRQRLKAKLGDETRQKVDSERRRGSFRDKITTFASILGLAISATTNLLLPALGVAI